MSLSCPISKTWWISREIFDWQLELGGGEQGDEVKTNRAYEIFSHAETLISQNASSLSLTDGILALKRTINHRLKLLDELYQLSSIFPKNIGALERLAAVGLARPFMIKQLFELRNDIEHNDQTPPSIFRCQELADITWYFLKATDAACLITQHEITFQCDKGYFARDPQLWISAKLNNQPHLKVYGWIDKGLISETSLEGYLELQIDQVKVKQNFTKDHENRQESEFWISGIFDLNFVDHQRYLYKVFATSL